MSEMRTRQYVSHKVEVSSARYSTFVPHSANACWISGPYRLMHLDPFIVEPPIKAAHEALRIHGAAVHVGGPGRETDHSGLNQTHQHPGQGFEMPAIDPVFMLA